MRNFSFIALMVLGASLPVLFVTGCSKHNVTGPGPGAQSQWVATAGPTGGGIFCFVVSGTSLFAGTNGGVYRATDNGASWTAVNSGLPREGVRALAVRTLTPIS